MSGKENKKQQKEQKNTNNKEKEKARKKGWNLRCLARSCLHLSLVETPTVWRFDNDAPSIHLIHLLIFGDSLVSIHLSFISFITCFKSDNLTMMRLPFIAHSSHSSLILEKQFDNDAPSIHLSFISFITCFRVTIWQWCAFHSSLIHLIHHLF